MVRGTHYLTLCENQTAVNYIVSTHTKQSHLKTIGCFSERQNPTYFKLYLPNFRLHMQYPNTDALPS